MARLRPYTRLILALILPTLLLTSCGGRGRALGRNSAQLTPAQLQALTEQHERDRLYEEARFARPAVSADAKSAPFPESQWFYRPGAVYTRGSNAWELAHAMGDSLRPGQHRIVYLAPFGTDLQLRVRVFPYPGWEALLWHGEGAPWDTSCALSPGFTHVALLLGRTRSDKPRELLIVPLDGGKARSIAPAQPTEKWKQPTTAFWRDDDTLEVFANPKDSREATRWVYKVGADRLEFLGDLREGWPEERALLAERFGDKITAMERAASRPNADRGLASLSIDELTDAVLLGADIAAFPFVRRGGGSVAAVSEDGAYAAMKTKDKPVEVVGIGDANAATRYLIPRSALFVSESVSQGDLHWSPDSQHLTFTEVHYHQARFHAPDMGGDTLRPWDATYLVRLYTPETNDVQTITIGSGAFLLPDVLPPAATPNPPLAPHP